MVRPYADVVVVGAGSSGCAVAARLNEAGAEVELLEAGHPAKALRGPLQDAMDCDLSGRLDWGYEARVTNGRAARVPRGRVVGGSSVINTCVALRPDPPAFDAWARLAPGWGWNEVLPYFRRLESDRDFPTASYHGASGPVPIVRWREEELAAASRAFLNAARAIGLPNTRDLNAPHATGVGLVPMNRNGRDRASADTAYLGSAQPAGLRVSCGRVVDRLALRGTRVVGVTSHGRDGTKLHSARHVVICAGAYATPLLLMRSGIGPADELKRIGVPVVHERRGVGHGLIDHSQVHLVAAGPVGEPDRPALQTLVKTTTARSDVTNDVQLCVLNRVDLDRYAPDAAARGHALVMLCALLEHSESRGTVAITSTDPSALPRIDIDYVAADGDRWRYRLAMRMLAAIIAQAEFAPFQLLPGEDLANLDDEAVDHIVAERVQTAHHPMGTARTGPSDDPYSVAAADLSVYGIEGLSIADASVIPVSLNANIHLTCTMIGERAAELLQ